MKKMSAKEVFEFLQDLWDEGKDLSKIPVYCLVDDEVIGVASVIDYDGESVNLY